MMIMTSNGSVLSLESVTPASKGTKPKLYSDYRPASYDPC